MPSETANPYRLTRAVTPSRYELTLEPDLDKATFTGVEAIDVQVHEQTDTITLNAAELELDEAWLESDAAGRTEVTDVSLDEEMERATLKLASPVSPGDHVLRIRFRGVLNDKLRGFYRSRYTDSDGVEHTIATTQFEATDARRAFPCWDEPDLKAVFGITLVVPQEQFVVSNSPVVSDVVEGDGRRRVQFGDTMKMSTYLVAFIVGPFEATDPVDVDGTPLRVVHPVGKGDLAQHALEIGAFCLRWFSDYYGIRYPGDKLDLVAVPDFAMGAMENLGCVTFRETLVLLDPSRVTQGELSRVAEVIAHELAHMWFGDLVTMRWWNGIWLNEAFATFMATACVDAYKPEWKKWTQFALDRSAAFDTDALENTRPIEYPVESPDDAEGMFDILTYEKGASVLRMLEQYLGAEQFREGIRHYLKKHQFANTETNDLWDALEEVTGQPARRIMDSWIFQGGFPLVSIAATNEGRVMRMGQRRFRFADDPAGKQSRWSVPVMMRVFAHDGGAHDHRELLEEGSVDATLDSGASAVLANAGGNGFYRVRYEPDTLAALADRMYQDLEPVERYGLIDDTWAATVAGHTSTPEFLAFARRFRDETDVEVWQLLAGCVTQLTRILEGEALEQMRQETRALFGPALERMGWSPRDEDSERARELRGVLIRAVAGTGRDEAALEKARGLHDDYLSDPSSVEPNIAAAVATVTAIAGTDDDYEAFVRRFKSAENPQEENRYLFALSEFPERSHIEKTLQMAMTDEVRTQNAPFLLGRCMTNRHHGDLAWRFIRDHWQQINDRFPDNTIVRMLGGLRALNDPDVAEDVQAFFKEHDVPQARLTLQQHLEKMRVNVEFRQRESERLADALR
ncbi:MAG: M1 family metallopeptidase [Chloroflexota bacterium]